MFLQTVFVELESFKLLTQIKMQCFMAAHCHGLMMPQLNFRTYSKLRLYLFTWKRKKQREHFKINKAGHKAIVIKI